MSFWKKAGSGAGLLCALIIGSACSDTYRPVASAIITPGGDPQPIHYAFAIFTNPNGPGGTVGLGSIEQIDVSGDSVLTVQNVGRDPIYASFIGSATGEVFVANRGDGSVSESSFFSTNPPSTTTLPLGSTPVALGSRQTSAEYVINTTSPGVCPAGAVNVLSTSNVVTNTVCVGNNPVNMTQVPNGGRIYVLNQADNTVSVIDPVSLAVAATVPVGSKPVWATTDLTGKYVFVVNQNSNSVTVISTIDNTTSTIPVGSAPNFAIFSPRRNRVYITNGGSNDLTVLDTSGATPVVLVHSVAVGNDPTGVVPLVDGSRVYVANTLDNSVTVLDGNSNTVVTTISLGPAASITQPLWIETEPTSTKVYVTTPAPPAGTHAANNPNDAPGITILKTSTNAISNFLQAPQADPSCQINPVTNTTCAYQYPVQILTFAR